MKKILALLILLLTSCQDYSPVSYSTIVNKKYQNNKLECITPELAINTNYYGMGTIETRSTDGGYYNNWEKIYSAYHNNELVETEPVEDAWWVLLENINLSCPHNNIYNGRIDMTGFNTGDSQGKCVYLTLQEQNPNCSNCSNQVAHVYEKKYLTDGQYTFVEIWAYSYPKNDMPKKVICKVYATFNYNPAKTYMLCIEDLGGECLDFNDCIIVGGHNMKPRVIYRMAANPMDIKVGNETYHLDGNMFGDYDIELPFNNMNTPSSWNGATITSNRAEIPILLNRIADMPAVIATDLSYRFHREENTMTSDEFVLIPFYH